MYAIANNLKGFGEATSLRVNVTRQEGDYVWVITCDLRDVGTRLVLDRSQIEPESNICNHPAWLHKDGLVAFN